jgi:hypothetical protein
MDGNDGRASPRGTVVAHDARENGRCVPSCNAKSDRRWRGEYSHRRLKEAWHQISEEHNRHLSGVSALSPPNFAIFLNDRSSHTGGDRGRRSAGRAPRDGGNAPHSRCFNFQFAFDVSADFHVGFPLKLAGIGPHTYTDVQWNATRLGSYVGAIRRTERPTSPDTPAFRFLLTCGSPSPDGRSGS